MALQISIEDITVRSLDVDYNEVSWKVRNTSQDLLDFTFQVLRSEGAAGPFDPISEEMDDRFFFIDNTIRKGNDYRQNNYVIRVRNKQANETKDFGPADAGADPDLIALELRKHMNLLFREFIGRRCWVLPARTFGQRCGCWNPTLQKRTQSHCLTCFDTGFVRGYLTPIESWISIDPDNKSEQNTNVGPSQQSNTTARMGFFPPVKNRDIIIEGENIRWRVNQVSGPEQLRAQVHQEFEIHKIPSMDIEYKIKFDIGGSLRNMWLSPARNFTNPTNFEVFKDEEFPRILQLYGSTYPPVRS
jgi:hypothetical protein